MVNRGLRTYLKKQSFWWHTNINCSIDFYFHKRGLFFFLSFLLKSPKSTYHQSFQSSSVFRYWPGHFIVSVSLPLYWRVIWGAWIINLCHPASGPHTAWCKINCSSLIRSSGAHQTIKFSTTFAQCISSTLSLQNTSHNVGFHCFLLF